LGVVVDIGGASREIGAREAHEIRLACLLLGGCCLSIAACGADQGGAHRKENTQRYAGRKPGFHISPHQVLPHVRTGHAPATCRSIFNQHNGFFGAWRQGFSMPQRSGRLRR
jgi:hypothetical protein